MLWMPLTMILNRRFISVNAVETDRVNTSGCEAAASRTHGKKTDQPSGLSTKTCMTATASAAAGSMVGQGKEEGGDGDT